MQPALARSQQMRREKTTMKAKVCGDQSNVKLTARARRALDAEINRQIMDADRKYTNAIDAAFLFFLHRHLGFGKKRLRRAWEQFTVIHDDLVAYYEMPDDSAWLADRKLQEIGVDVAAWNAEKKEDI